VEAAGTLVEAKHCPQRKIDRPPPFQSCVASKSAMTKWRSPSKQIHMNDSQRRSKGQGGLKFVDVDEQAVVERVEKLR